eukprot:704257-Lingulodinium_polyedra.AAC.1
MSSTDRRPTDTTTLVPLGSCFWCTDLMCMGVPSQLLVVSTGPPEAARRASVNACDNTSLAASQPMASSLSSE